MRDVAMRDQMKMTMIRIVIFGCVSLATVGSGAMAQESRTVNGTVTDSAGQPIPYVNIDGGRYRALTNAVGQWRLLIPNNEGLEIAIRRIGYLPARIRIERGSDTTVNLSLQRLALLLESQVVRARQLVRTLETRGFYERMADAEKGALVGEFITPEEIEMRNPQRVTQLLEQMPGIQVRRFGSCQVIDQCFRITGAGRCAATVYLDGQRLNRMASAANDINSAPTVDDVVPISGVSAVEVYPRGSSAPAKYQSFAGTCAIVVIWTK
ncbi:MAG TPA: carboxypeptidase regulatory-like domain-containing protein [Gemmatimonadaceae bacterium]